MKIRDIETVLVDVPTIRPHRLASSEIRTQSMVIVRLRTEEGLEGLGEATTIGGLSYGEESPEGIKLVIDAYMAPLLVGRDPRDVGALMSDIGRKARGNRLGKSALETALLDVTARALGAPLSALFGGRRMQGLEVAWGLATGDAGRDVEEAERLLEARRHRVFKIKIGADDPAADVARVAAVKRALGDRAGVRVDVNQAWDEPTAVRAIAALEDAGVELVEQPVARANTAAMARLAARFDVPIMADEAVATPEEGFELARTRAADVFALKIGKSGGLHATRALAEVAAAGGVSLYGGTLLEGSIATLAAAHLFAGLEPFAFGTELFGPLLLTQDVVTARPVYRDFRLVLPEGPGLGVEIDEDALAFFRRDRGSGRAAA